MMPNEPTVIEEEGTASRGVVVDMPVRAPVPMPPPAEALATRLPAAAPAASGGALVRRIATQAIPYLSNRLQFVGRSGVAGIALLVFALVCFTTANSPLHKELFSQRLALLDAERDKAAQRGSAAEANASQQLSTFVKRLPAREDLPKITDQIVKQAGDSGLALEKGNYDMTVTRSGDMVRARIDFPVTGSYPQIRQFIDGTLAVIPGAAVDGLKIERGKVGDAAVNAEVRFTVFVRNSP